MGIVEVKCEKCGKGVLIQDKYVREKMFCTLLCLSSYAEMPGKIK